MQNRDIYAKKQNIVEYCACKSANAVKYVKLPTGGNDPTISERSKYAKYVSTSSRRSTSSATTNIGFSMNGFS